MASSSYTASAGSGAASPDVLLRAHKAEIQQLKDALHELSLRDTSGGSAGFNEVLEGKYLAQIKKNKTLSVQLYTAQQQLADLQKALQVEQEKTKRLVTAATSMATAVKAKNGTAGRKAGRSETEDTDTEDEEGGTTGAKNADSASAAVQRVYNQLHQKEIAFADIQRENAALRALVQREVGLRDDSNEVDELLKRTTSALCSSKSNVAGWRGRAEEIVLLKSKLKDAQRRAEAMAAAAAAPTENTTDDASSPGRDLLGLPASVRAYIGMEDNASTDARSATTTTMTTATAATITTRRKDVDDDARDRLTAMQQQRAAQQRQQVVNAETQQRQLEEEKLRTAALQARVKTMKSELDTLRGYVGTILDKSATDDELVEAYRAEVQKAQAEVRDWQKKAAAAATVNNASRENAVTAGVKNNAGAAMAAAAARSAQYRKATAPSEVAADSGEGESTLSFSSPVASRQRHQQQRFSMENVDAVVYEWTLRACQESSAAVVRGRAVNDASSYPPPPITSSAIAAVLRSALHHVAQVERQATAAGDHERTCSEGEVTAASGVSVKGGTQAENVLLIENASLKRRIRALTEMMDREMQAQKVLWSSRDGQPEYNSTREKE